MKRILLILAIITIALTGNAQLQQMWLGGQSAGGGAGVNLDDYPPDAVYGLVNLLSSWSGNDVVGVRKAGETSVTGYTKEEISNGTILANCTSDCYVQELYDQSGNGYDIIQSDTSKQPKIVSSGSLILDSDGNICIHVPTANAGIGLQHPWVGAETHYFFVMESNSTSSIFFSDPLSPSRYAGAAVDGQAVTALSSNVVSQVYRKNGSAISPVTRDDIHTEYYTGVPVLVNFHFERNGGWPGSAQNFFGYQTNIAFTPVVKYPCLVIYASDQTSNEAAIETIINEIFSIY